NLESEIESGHGKGANGDDIEAGDSICENGSGKKRKVEKTKKGVSPRKVVHQKKGRYVKKGRKSSSAGPSGLHEGAGPSRLHEGTGPSGASGGPIVPSDSDSDFGPNNVGTGKPKPKIYQPKFVPSDDDYVYEYESENLHTPVSSEEEYKKHDWP
ncbi:hypothetical protein PIB30_114552, partial [Stylosanthes scabra]|nr:hypothetical protein [Stylosanthes scabra]